MRTQQKDLCKSFTGPIQTDALESFVDGPTNCVLCISSGFVGSINRTIPLAHTILFGKSELHYRCNLFESLDMVLRHDVDADDKLSLCWSVMVVDFSTAQHMAFLHEFQVAVQLHNQDIDSCVL